MKSISTNLTARLLSCPLPDKKRQQSYQEEEKYEFATTDGSIVDSFAGATAVALGLGIVVGGFYIGVDIHSDSSADATQW